MDMRQQTPLMILKLPDGMYKLSDNLDNILTI